MVCGLRLSVLLASVLVLLTSGDSTALRVRKSWKMFSTAQKQNYLGAVRSAMRNGGHLRFAQIHASMPSNNYAHNNCGFLLWHRKFLLAYENMLRDQGVQYSDVTLPYWNYFEDHDIHLSTNTPCNSMLECSQFLSDFGGSSILASPATQTFEDEQKSGPCVSTGIAGHACYPSRSGRCLLRCIVRGPWYQPSNFLTLAKGQILQVFQTIDQESETFSNAHDTLRLVLEQGFHGQVHMDLGGVMSSQGSPFDPIFYGHHAMVDMIQFIYNRCYHTTASVHVDTETNPRFNVFSWCLTDTNVSISASSPIGIAYNGVSVAKDPVVGKYFAGIGSSYEDFQNAESLGVNSYTYKVDQYFEKTLQGEGIQCPSYVFASSASSSSKKKHKSKQKAKEAEEEQLHDSNPIAEMITTLSACGKELKDREAAMSHVGIAIQQSILECEATRQRSCHEMEDYSPEFRESFKLPADRHPYCYTLLNAVKEGHIALNLSETCRYEFGRMTGTQLTEEFFGKALNCTAQNSSSSYTEDSESTAKEHHQTHLSIKVHANYEIP